MKEETKSEEKNTIPIPTLMYNQAMKEANNENLTIEEWIGNLIQDFMNTHNN